MMRSTFFILAALVFCSVHAADIYKYKDSRGNWVFSDKKPDSKKKKFETLKYKPPKSKYPSPRLAVQEDNGDIVLVADNPLHAPLELVIEAPQKSGLPNSIVVAANSKDVILRRDKSFGQFRYHWLIGDPSAIGGRSYRYQFPVASITAHKITQAFNGRFSHNQRPNIYAVDIAMAVGTDIQAARSGTVFGVKDDYHMGGAKKYFLDKANYISVLHEDGTYADYAHILLGSAVVKPGDFVAKGEVIAQSGTSGYSTGPHLHFVVRANEGGKTVSLPFEFIDANGQSVRPSRGSMVRGR